jgi:hypothetical protein
MRASKGIVPARAQERAQITQALLDASTSNLPQRLLAECGGFPLLTHRETVVAAARVLAAWD